eukprot:TRINITY_DN1130_c2_g1_i1.p1 TRINITY_DN1130_c2_g1~~TRINITY_DN1130_c2_g1_i1.p1  ORF type:complete len:378 (+),score=51.22 TRINITY_DN1130_c2_g1_i1:45-1136(+)
MPQPVRKIPLQIQRLRTVRHILNDLGITRIVDGGAGEGEGGMYWMSKERDSEGIDVVIQVERDVEVLKKQQHNWDTLQLKLRNIDNENIVLDSSLVPLIRFTSSMRVDSFLGDLSYYSEDFHSHLQLLNITTCVLCEVIEHSSLPEARNLLNTLLGQYEFETLILTTPNILYNKHFDIPDGCFRHLDHEWEMTPTEWNTFISDIASIYGYRFDILWIGDSSEDGAATQGAVLRRDPCKMKNEPHSERDLLAIASVPLQLHSSFCLEPFDLSLFAASFVSKYCIPRSPKWSRVDTVIAEATDKFISIFSVPFPITEVKSLLLSEFVESNEGGDEVRSWPCHYCSEYYCWCDDGDDDDGGESGEW